MDVLLVKIINIIAYHVIKIIIYIQTNVSILVLMDMVYLKILVENVNLLVKPVHSYIHFVILV